MVPGAVVEKHWFKEKQREKQKSILIDYPRQKTAKNLVKCQMKLYEKDINKKLF